MSSDDPLNIGILGAANIARYFIDAARTSTRVRVGAIASRDIEKGKAFALAQGVPVVHPSYDALLADPAIDAIYNPLPNNLHAEWSIRAAQARKHVLCEKPLCLSSRDATAMFEAAEANGVYLVEAYPYRCQPQTIALRELLKDGLIGKVLTIQASMGFLVEDLRNIRFNPALGGGALLDVGSYPVSLVRMIAGERATRVQALACWSSTGVDSSMVGSMEHASGLLAQISCGLSTARHRLAVIVGDKGTLTTTYHNDTSAAMPPTIHVTHGARWDARQEIIETPATSGFLAEAESFAALVRGGWSAWPGASQAESKDIVATLEALAESARTVRTVTLG
jgi:D-xylose 1-dehydrogenase (NADP+, D-xylono-1,5-lactone-forming)